MPSDGHEGQERNADADRSPTPSSGPVATGPGGDRDAVLRGVGEDLARLLRDGREHGRPASAALRTLSRTVAGVAGDDHEVHRVLVDVSVAAPHLGREGALRAYARSRRRTLDGGPAVALLDGMLQGLQPRPPA